MAALTASELDEMVAGAREAHPAFVVDEGAFRRHAVAVGVAVRHAADLYLCFACLGGDRLALAELDRRLARASEPVLARMGLDRVERDEVRQRVRERLLVSGGAARLGSYTGRGALAPWLRACATRVALNAFDAERRHAAAHDDDAWLAWPSPDDDAELAYLRRSCGEAFKRAASEALAALPPAARLLLRQHHLDGVSAERLGALYGVHATTVQRRLQQAREDLLRETRRRLGEAVPLRPHELDSLVRLLGSQLELSVRRLLGTCA
jgi:RNA polymerase sigma-70 factor (ECF subfamily)